MQRELHVELFDTAAQSDAPLKGVAPAAVLAGSDLGSSPLQHGVEVVTLRAFDLEDRPVVVGLASLPGELVPARSTVALPRGALGSSVVVVLEKGDPRRPIILGVIGSASSGTPTEVRETRVRVDDADKLVLRAEREIVLECGEASITLTRAGKVLIRGHYILSRASGYNRIKGAAIDIN